MTQEEKDKIEESGYSKGRFGLCANKGCWNERRTGKIKSAYCQECSDHLKEKK